MKNKLEKSTNCPNCGARRNDKNYNCSYCGSIFIEKPFETTKESIIERYKYCSYCGSKLIIYKKHTGYDTETNIPLYSYYAMCPKLKGIKGIFAFKEHAYKIHLFDD